MPREQWNTARKLECTGKFNKINWKTFRLEIVKRAAGRNGRKDKRQPEKGGSQHGNNLKEI
jgi:hypothetical protein